MLKLVDILKYIGNALKVDYIVEEGTSGIWTYRKWNSGITEIWGLYSGNMTAYSTVYYGWYPFVKTLNLPYRVYNPNINFIFQFASTYCIPMGIGTHAPAWLDAFNVYGFASQSSGLGTFNIQIKGRWK